MSLEHFQSLEMKRFRRLLTKIHEQVACKHGRIEVTHDGCDHVCVVLSKAELDSLERAMEILAESAAYKEMCDHLSQVAADCGAYGAAGIIHPEV